MSQHPFANGTEQECWQAKWCDHCAHDHAMHNDGAAMSKEDPWGCDILMFTAIPDELPWPEAWVAAPDFWRHLPARIACLRFEPCTNSGCDGDPGEGARPAYVAAILDDFRQAHGPGGDPQ